MNPGGERGHNTSELGHLNKNPHAPLKEGGELEKNPGSDREITPEFTTDRCLTHTHTFNTTYYLYLHARSIGHNS